MDSKGISLSSEPRRCEGGVDNPLRLWRRIQKAPHVLLRAGDEALEEYLGQIQGFLDAGYQYAMVTDATGVEVPITARQGALIHQWTMQNQAALARYNLGHAIVVSTPMMSIHTVL